MQIIFKMPNFNSKHCCFNNYGWYVVWITSNYLKLMTSLVNKSIIV